MYGVDTLEKSVVYIEFNNLRNERARLIELKWNKKRNETLNTRLTNALKDSNPMLKVAYTSDEIEQIRKTVKGKGYRITNSLNKNITKEW